MSGTALRCPHGIRLVFACTACATEAATPAEQELAGLSLSAEAKEAEEIAWRVRLSSAVENLHDREARIVCQVLLDLAQQLSSAKAELEETQLHADLADDETVRLRTKLLKAEQRIEELERALLGAPPPAYAAVGYRKWFREVRHAALSREDSNERT